MKRSQRTAQRILVLLSIMLAAACGSAAGDGWSIRPEMRLSAVLETVVPVARFDFEHGQDGWQARHPEVKLQQAATTTGMTGKGVLRVCGREPSGWNFAASPQIAVEPGKTYRASMWIRLESQPESSRQVFFKIEFVPDNHQKGGQVSSASVPPDKLRQWCRLEVEFQAPANCHRVWAAIEKGTDTPAVIDASIDEFALEEVAGFSIESSLEKGQLTGPITKTLANVHPRIYLTARKLADLRTQVRDDPRWRRIRDALFRIADEGVRSGPPDYDKEVEHAAKSGEHGENEQLWQRRVGNMIPHLALAYLLSDDQKYLVGAKQWISASLAYKTWGLGKTDGMDLAAGHQLAGIGLAYDWLYHDLSQAEREQIRQGVVKRAGVMARAAITCHTYWCESYMQNHLWVNSAGLATAGFAMCDEVDEARGWIRLAHEKFLTTLTTVGDDGASHEGYGYWEYGSEYVMRYLEMAHDLLGIDLYRGAGANHPWLAQSPLYALYLALPRETWTRTQSVVDLGDNPRFHWYGPSYILRNLARRYPDSTSSGIAQWFAEEVESAGIDATSSGHYLNLLWYDPPLPQTPPQGLPTLHHFEDIGIVSARSDWSETGSLLVVKCGPPLGHRQLHAPYDYGAGHVHPDAGHFVFFSRGQFLLRDDGYSYNKLTANHNTVLINGKGQKGEGNTWFDYAPWLLDQRAPQILSVRSSRGLDEITCDVAPAYQPDSGLKTFVRTFRFRKPSRLEIQDELRADRPVEFQSLFHVEGKLTRLSPTTYRLVQKDVAALLSIDAGTQANAEIRNNGTQEFLCLTSVAPQLQARFTVVITVEDGRPSALPEPKQ